jgi:uncharacterized membrane protein
MQYRYNKAVTRASIPPGVQYVLALCAATLVSMGLLLAGYISGQGPGDAYLAWNLFLAWLPFGLSLWLMRVLGRKAWSSWEGLAVSGVWLAFLPNSFYMVSDFIHLPEAGASNALFNAVLFTSFIFTGLALGVGSLYLVHTELRRRLTSRGAGAWIAAILLVCSVAIYIGRDLRWNTWDVLFDPAGLLFDLSSRLLHPSAYLPMLAVVAPFFVLLASLYTIVWQGSRVLEANRK